MELSKPIEEMTREEVADELARVRAAKAATNGAVTAPEDDLAAEWARTQAAAAGVPEAEARLSEAMGLTDEPEAEAEAPAPAAWPHLTLEYGGHTLEVRKPNESALIAIAMTGVPSLGPQGQMRIFSTFLSNHMSQRSFVEVVEAMTDPDSPVDIQGLIQAMTQL